MEQQRQSNLLTSTTVPNLQPPISTSSSSNWFNNHIMNSSFDEDDDPNDQNNSTDISHNDEDNEFSHQFTPSPKRILTRGFTGISTPLNRHNNISFSSPINKLNDLHINSDILDAIDNDENDDDDDSSINDDNLNEHRPNHSNEFNDNRTIPEENEDEENDEDIGNKTIINNSESESDSEIEPNSNLNSLEDDLPPPKYISIRKRHHVDTPTSASSSIKNNTNNNSIIIHHNHTPMSMCTDNSSLMDANKLSFSTSDSTPCPPQPKRKKLKFKSSSSNLTKKKPILDLSHSIKTSILQAENIATSEDHSDNQESEVQNYFPSNTTPISQSTPSNSRASTPPLQTQPQSNQSSTRPQVEEYGDSINGFRFVKSKSKATTTTTTTSTSTSSHTTTRRYNYNYETPINNNKYFYQQHFQQPLKTPTSNIKSSGSASKYQIMGEIPVTAAGLMNESDEDIHIGDKRINDPYLKNEVEIEDISMNEESDIVHTYINDQTNQLLPLPAPQFYLQPISDKQSVLQLINDSHSIATFYQNVSLVTSTPIIDILRRERIKWHPDKWVKLTITDVTHPFDSEIVDNLSKVINGMIKDLE
ncbi:uncharacterized protein RJT21DRAFT_119013 [Scheffersomyces amazonensis]|uniref:uncharacterized protein n=1 Tax=Scheffersomyces amazonensis TaxID=1078765 RepID=UPI00315DC034